MNVLIGIDVGLVEVARRYLAWQATKDRTAGDVQRSLVAAYAVFTFVCIFTHDVLVLRVFQVVMAVLATLAVLHPRLLGVPLRTQRDFERAQALAASRTKDPTMRFVRLALLIFTSHILVFLAVDLLSNGRTSDHLAFVALSMIVTTAVHYVMAAPPSMPRPSAARASGGKAVAPSAR